jgi:hypothetical protein
LADLGTKAGINAHRSGNILLVVFVLFLKTVSIPDSYKYVLDTLHLTQNFKKILLAGTEFFHADRRPGMTKKTDAFRTFANATEKICGLKKNCFITQTG